MRLATARRVWQRWQAAAGPWIGWSVCPALVTPEALDIRISASPRPVADEIAARLASSLGQRGTAVILDLDPILGIHVAARLNQLRLANAVLLLPRWPYRQAVLPVDGLLDGLVTQATRLQHGELTHVAFVLDAERNRALVRRSRHDERADNRYRLAVADLPNLAFLSARDIHRIVKLSAA
jgi:hypothetical protein